VILFNEIKDRMPPTPAGAPAPQATTSIADLPEPIRSQLSQLLSEAYSSTFVWALVLLAVAFLPTLLLPRGKNKATAVVGAEPASTGGSDKAGEQPKAAEAEKANDLS
jgi:uncharacterized membrane protein